MAVSIPKRLVSPGVVHRAPFQLAPLIRVSVGNPPLRVVLLIDVVCRIRIPRGVTSVVLIDGQGLLVDEM